jgi:hypothetical protein
VLNDMTSPYACQDLPSRGRIGYPVTAIVSCRFSTARAPTRLSRDAPDGPGVPTEKKRPNRPLSRALTRTIIRVRPPQRPVAGPNMDGIAAPGIFIGRGIRRVFPARPRRASYPGR